MNNTPNISGTNGKLLHVTEEDLAKHNKRTDCWMAISGKKKRREKIRSFVIKRKSSFSFI